MTNFNKSFSDNMILVYKKNYSAFIQLYIILELSNFI